MDCPTKTFKVVVKAQLVSKAEVRRGYKKELKNFYLK